MASILNWAIIGLGSIAHKFAHDLLLVESANLYAVGSRSIEKAREFANQYKADKAYASYEEVVNDDNVDVVYIATPHTLHFENTMMCLEAGKHVLTEKPFAMQKSEVEQMIALARAKQLFLMEAFWTRFIPATNEVLNHISSGALGDIRMVTADFGFYRKPDFEGRLFNKDLGGGSLLDIGIYPIFITLLTMGQPDNILASATKLPNGVDSACSMIFEYNDGRRAMLNSNILLDTPTEATILGTKGRIRMHTQFHHTDKLTLYQGLKTLKSWQTEHKGNGYFYEILEVTDCITLGSLESPKMTHQNSLELIGTLDRVRELINLNY